MWTPHEMPFILEKAASEYVHIADVLRNAAHEHGNMPAETRKGIAGVEESAAFLRSPLNLLWADSGICELLETGGEVPPWSPETCLPSPNGFVGLEHPFFTAPYEHRYSSEFSPVLVSGIGWETIGGTIRVTAWCQQQHVPVEARSQIRTQLAMEELFAVSMPAGDVVDADVMFRGFSAPGADQAAKELVSAIGGFWLLMTQPTIIDETETVAKVRKRRGGKAIKAPVRVSVRSLARRRSSSSSGGGRGKATSRWWVRGHWRQQPWGEGRKLRKPVFIAPHTAGAKDAPIDKRPKVQVWRTGKQQNRPK